MDLWDSFWSALIGFISDAGLLAIAVIVLLRSAAIPIPVPADLLVVAVGARAREQQLVLWPAWLVLSGSTTIGAVLFYAFVRWIGHGDIAHYGRYVGLTAERLNSAEAQLGARGVRAVFVARIIPGLRLAIVAVCGMLRFGWWKFVAAVALGALIYVGMCLAIGYVFGDAIIALLGRLVLPLGLLEPVAGLSILLFWLVRARRAHMHQPSATEAPLSRSKRVRAGALTGALAISGSTMLVNALIYLAAPVAATLLGLTNDVQSIITFSGGLAQILESLLGTVVFGILWGIVYAVEDGRWGTGRSDWVRGVLFAALPFALVMLLQLVVIVQRDRPGTAWGILGPGEVIRWSTYGVLVGLIYPVLRTRRAHAIAERPSAGQTSVMVESPGE
jgi:membrane protein DedA with SNARE-associated domain